MSAQAGSRVGVRRHDRGGRADPARGAVHQDVAAEELWQGEVAGQQLLGPQPWRTI